MRWVAALGCAALLIGCGSEAPPPEGQVVVYVTTDAPLPAAPGDPPGDVPALFDRLDLAVFEPGAASA